LQEKHCFMKIPSLKKSLLVVVLFVSSTTKMFCQSENVTVSQDSKFEQLLNEKRKINAVTPINDRFEIQIYNGDAETAKTTLTDFKKNYKNTDGTIVFNTPIYKVRVGRYKSRIEAEKNLKDLKKKYPNAFLVKPGK
jgi:hypothetical protein